MSTAKAPLTDSFQDRDVNIRGVIYTLHELSAGEYDDIIKIATSPDQNTDMTAVMRMMTVKSLISPRLTVEALKSLPFPVYNKLVGEVSSMHFDPLEDEAAEAPNA